MGVSEQAIGEERGLVAKAKSGETEAFGELYERHHARAYRTAMRILHNQHDAEDAVQRAFQRALMNLGRFREACTFSTWLTRITINEALMVLRQRRRGEPLLDSDVDAGQTDSGVNLGRRGRTPEEILCERERRAALHQAIGKLREKLKTIVVHRELKGLTSAETAELLGLSVGAVKARVFHARKFLRRHLEREFAGGGLLGKAKKPKSTGRSACATPRSWKG